MQTDATPLMDLRISTLGASLIIVMLVAVAHLAMRWYTKRRVLQKESNPPAVDTPRERSARRTLAMALLGLIGPLALLLWIVGLHYALSILLADIDHPLVARYGAPALAGLRGVGVILALMWLLSRIGRII